MKLSKKEFLAILKEKNACSEAVEWVKESKTETFVELWNECERADWMLWILARMIKEKGWPSRKTVVLCACDCAETSLQFIPEDEPRPKIAIQTARKWTEGKASERECAKAAAASVASSYAYFAAASFASSSASVYAAHVAAYSAYVVASSASSVSSAASASASFAASSVVSYAAAAEIYSINRKEALKNMADIIRKRINFRKD
jgi:hypothetical protein